MTYYNITWGKTFLRSLNAPYNEETDKFLRAWAQAEGTPARWNPFATTQKMTGSTTTKNPNGTLNSAGVQDYLTWISGVNATTKTILNGKYGPLVAAIRRGESAANMAVALGESPWGTKLAYEIVTSSKGPLDYPIGNCYPVPATAWSRTIKPGMTGPDVDELLRYLGNTGKFYDWNIVHGNFAGKVKSYQKLRPWLWPADGIVGPKTYKSITGHA
jgi:hypothetical protein